MKPFDADEPKEEMKASEIELVDKAEEAVEAGTES